MSTAADVVFERRYQAGVDRARAISASLAGPSLFERFARLPADARDRILGEFGDFDLARLLFDWASWARPKQDPDLDAIAHRILLFLAGRGFGKSMSGAQRVRKRVLAGACSIGLIGPTLSDVEKYMIGGKGGADGLLGVFPPEQEPKWRPHKRELEFHTGAIAYINTAEEPEFRGANLDTVWADEPGKWRYLDRLWTNIELSTRLPGELELELIITGTPLPLKQFREWVADEDTVTIIGETHENASNTDPRWLAKMQAKLGGTRQGRQELGGEILSDNPDALFSATKLDADRVEEMPDDIVEAAIAVDPAISTKRDNDDTGVIGGGRDARGHIYVWIDATREKAKPEQWGADVITACEQNRIDTVVGERNRGGDLVASNVRAAKERKRGAAAAHALKIVDVQATRGKAIRAEPVSTLHEKGMIHIVGRMPELEGELTSWNPRLGGDSPNRLDAFVWLVWYLAKLGDVEVAPRAPVTSKGLKAATTAIRPAAAPRSSGLAGSFPRAQWGSKL